MRISDWSSDVCSSDLEGLVLGGKEGAHQELRIFAIIELHAAFAGVGVHRLALAVADHRRQRRLIVAKLVDRGQIAREDRPDQSDTKQTGEREIAEPAEPAPRPHVAQPCDDSTAIAEEGTGEKTTE